MLHVYTCLAEQHDRRLVVVALAVAALGSLATFTLLRHVQARTGLSDRWPKRGWWTRAGWLIAAAIAAGSATWSTHFVAMLAFAPGTPTGYAAGLTILSFAVVMAAMAVAFATALHLSRRAGGVLAGLGIGAMHYLGMAAFRVGGRLVWDRELVVLSLLAGTALAALAFQVGLAGRGQLRRLIAASLFALAIAALHFTGMAAASVIPDSTLPVPAASLPPAVLAVAVTLGCLIILGIVALALLLEQRELRRNALELVRMRDLADATVEGLLVCDGDVVVTANRSFAEMSGCPAEALVGRCVTELLGGPCWELPAAFEEGAHAEAVILVANGDPVPVETLTRRVSYGGQSCRVVACRDLRARRRAEDRARFLALHDIVTALPNRTTFIERVTEEVTAPDASPIAIVKIDIDRFRAVNDALGHALGDALLRALAARIQSLAVGAGAIASLGGARIVILRQAIGAREHAARLLAEIAAPFEINGRVITLTASIGIATSPMAAVPGDDPARQEAASEILLQQANLALQRAKQNGGNALCVYEPDMDEPVRESRVLELDLRRAEARGELEVWFQPQCTLTAGRLDGFEALLRWRHPTRGLVSPGGFIPLAEQSGLIVPIGAAVLRTAMREAQSWPAGLTVAINLSPVQIRSPELFGTVTAALEATGLDPRRLELEVTETVLLAGDPAIVRTLHRLRTLGIRMALDDFGTGFSSLSYLRSFPFDRLKIDRSFVAEVATSPECQAIVRAIIGLGRTLQIATTAEGVESEAQLAFLRGEGCDDVQGYLIGRPMPAAEARAMIARALRLSA